MTDRWLNHVLAVVVVLGLIAVTVIERPRLAEERAELLDQEVVDLDDSAAPPPQSRDPIELRERARERVEEEAMGERPDLLDDHGVTASHPDAVAVGMEVLDAGGNAVDAAIAVAYALGVAEPFGSGPGGGGAMLIHHPGEDPIAYDYRETAPLSGEVPADNIGVPGFVAGMEHIHAEHGSLALSDLIEPAARLAEDGVEVTTYLNERLRGAGHRLPIHLAPRLFPNGQGIAAGETLRQPEYADALRLIQDQGAEVMYTGELAERIVEVSGLEAADLEAYEVIEVEPAQGTFAGFDVIGGGAPTSGPTLVQMLQIAEALGVNDLDLDTADAHHVIAQAWRQAASDRREYVADPTIEQVRLDGLVDREYADALAARIPDDGFVDVAEDDELLFIETDTTHFVVIDRKGTMVSATNTLSNFFGSGLPVSGFFLNDQLKNFAGDTESINHVAPGKRPRSFITPTIVAQDGRPVLGIGSPGGRRIPMMVAQVLIRWAGHGQDLQAATDAPRYHLESTRLEVETMPSGGVADDLRGRGYTVTTNVPTTEYFGGMQALRIDHDAGTVIGIADDRRAGSWDATSR